MDLHCNPAKFQQIHDGKSRVTQLSLPSSSELRKVIPRVPVTNNVGCLSSSPQVDFTEMKATQLVYYQTIMFSLYSQVMYTSVRPHLEYCVLKCMRHFGGDIDKRERLQRLAIRLVSRFCLRPYAKHLYHLKLFLIRGPVAMVISSSLSALSTGFKTWAWSIFSRNVFNDGLQQMLSYSGS